MDNAERRRMELVSAAMEGRLTRRQLVKRAGALGLGMGVISSLLAACGGGATPTTAAVSGGTTPTSAPGGAASPSASPGSGTPAGSSGQASGKYTTFSKPTKTGGHVTEGTFADAKTVNPVLVSDTSSGAITALIYNGMLLVNPDTLQPDPDAAEK